MPWKRRNSYKCRWKEQSVSMNILATILLAIGLLTDHPICQQANISVLIKDAQTGQVIDEHRSDNVVPPASVMKLLTTGAALEMFGPSFRFTTTLEYTGTIENGVLNGNLYIRGGCDPSLGNLKGTQAFLFKWVKAVKAAGIRSIKGAVIADMSLLDGDATNPNWLWEDCGNYYAPGIFALNYMSNTLNIVLKSGPVGSVAEVIRTEPEYPGLVTINHIRCTEITYDGAYVHGLPYSRERYLTGSVPSNKGQFGVRSDMPNPGWMLALHLTKFLQEAGVAVEKPAASIAERGLETGMRQVIYEHKSDSLGALIAETNIYSNNLYAESIFRYMGLNYGKPGTIHNSCEVVREFWRLHGVSTKGALIKDGCGLAPQDAVSAETLVQLLQYMIHSKYRDVWIKSLPVSGGPGTITGLCRGTVLEGKIHAKSGTIAGTKNFAGYIDLPNGGQWVFAILVNSAQGKAKNVQTVIQNYLLDVYKANQ